MLVGVKMLQSQQQGRDVVPGLEVEFDIFDVNPPSVSAVRRSVHIGPIWVKRGENGCLDLRGENTVHIESLSDFRASTSSRMSDAFLLHEYGLVPCDERGFRDQANRSVGAHFPETGIRIPVIPGNTEDGSFCHVAACSIAG